MTALAIYYAAIGSAVAFVATYLQGRPVTRESVGAGVICGAIWPVIVPFALALVWAYFDGEDHDE